MHKDADTSGAAEADASWFQDEGILLTELKRSQSVMALPRIAGYDDLREIKRGGQGVVYEGTQRSTKRRVAVKVLLDSAYYSTSGIRRFERETDLAASLRHPSIVRVYDSGISDDGRAFLVMEFVEGLPLDDWAAERGRDARAVLDVFAQVCDAIQHAHMRGVIHRDIKPSNVRVDSEGLPRVLDFGLAKITADASAAGGSSGSAGSSVLGVGVAARAAAERTLTTTGQFVGSLPYASPEQARGEQQNVDTRSDVYSLGVVLYQLLTGAYPYDVGGALNQALNNIVSAPVQSARALRPDLDEQIDIILATALAKEPADRYQSAGALASDIRHHLRGDPIAARRESAWKSLRRQAARYRTLAWAGATVLATLVVASVLTLNFARTASGERDVANRQRARSEATVQFLTNLIGSASPLNKGGGRDARVVDLLQTAADSLDETYEKDPATRATLHDLLGQVFTRLEEYPKAAAHFESAIAIAEEHPDAFDNKDDPLAFSGDRASLAVAMRNWEEGIKLHTACVNEHALRGITKRLSLSSSWSDMGICYRNLGKLDEADKAYESALAALPDSTEASGVAGVILGNRAMLLEAMGKLDQAVPLMEQALAVHEKVYGPESVQTTQSRSNLAFLLIATGDAARAIPMMEQSVAASERTAGLANSSTLIAMNNLAKTYADNGRMQDALAMYERTVEAYRTLREVDDLDSTAPLNNMAALLVDLGEYDRSLAYSEQVIGIVTRKNSLMSVSGANAHNNTGSALEKLGRFTEAETNFRKAIEITGPEGGVLPAGHWRHEGYRLNLGKNMVAQKRLEEGRALVVDAGEKIRAKLPPTHLFWKRVDAAMVLLLRAEGKTAEADALEAEIQQRGNAPANPPK